MLATKVARRLPSVRIHFASYANALIDAGEPAKARAICERLLRETPEDDAFPLGTHRHLLSQQLALAEAALGEHARAAERLEALLTRFAASDNPLLLGALHHDRASVALNAADIAAFNHHFERTQGLFAATHNPWLIQQSDALLTCAVRHGLRPAAPPRALQAIQDSSTEMDGKTSIELREPAPDHGATELDPIRPE